MISFLEDALIILKASSKRFQHDPNYQKMTSELTSYLNTCIAHPRADVEISEWKSLY